MPNPAYLKLNGNGRLAYVKTEGSGPGVMFLGGFRSDMTGVKALALESFCRERGQAFVRFDYQAHGASSGAFERCTVGTWLGDAALVLTKLTKGPQILVGSSMGGWLALLLAIAKPRRVAGFIGIAPAPDFTDRMYYERFSDAQRKELDTVGKVMVPSDMGPPYPVTKHFIEEGRQHLLLHREIPVYCPVRILQGMKDDVVPWEVSLSINEKVATQDVKTILIDGGDHRLSEPADIEKLLSVTAKMTESLRQEAVKKRA